MDDYRAIASKYRGQLQARPECLRARVCGMGGELHMSNRNRRSPYWYGNAEDTFPAQLCLPQTCVMHCIAFNATWCARAFSTNAKTHPSRQRTNGWSGSSGNRKLAFLRFNYNLNSHECVCRGHNGDDIIKPSELWSKRTPSSSPSRRRHIAMAHVLRPFVIVAADAGAARAPLLILR